MFLYRTILDALGRRAVRPERAGHRGGRRRGRDGGAGRRRQPDRRRRTAHGTGLRPARGQAQGGRRAHPQRLAERAEQPPGLRRGGEQVGHRRIGQQVLQLRGRGAACGSRRTSQAKPRGSRSGGGWTLRGARRRRRGGGRVPARNFSARRAKRSAVRRSRDQSRASSGMAIPIPAPRAARPRHSPSITRAKRSAGAGGAEGCTTGKLTWPLGGWASGSVRP